MNAEYVFLVLWIAFYAVNVPFVIAFAASGTGFGVGAGVFFHMGALKRAYRRAAGLEKMRKDRMAKMKKHLRREALCYIIKRTRVERIWITGVLSFENAMHTALASGFVRALSDAAPFPVENGLKTDFVFGKTRAEVSGIVTMRIGHIIFAAAKLAAISIKERIGLWTDTRSKGL